MTSGGQRRRILVVVKTYPNPSQSYVESVLGADKDVPQIDALDLRIR